MSLVRIRSFSCRAFAFWVFVLATAMPTPMFAASPKQEAVYQAMLNFRLLVKGGAIDPHWMKDGQSFWYTEGTSADRRFIKVDPSLNSTSPMFDVGRLRAALTTALGYEPREQGIPFDTLDSIANNDIIGFAIDGKYFRMDLTSYTITPSAQPSMPPQIAPAAPVLYQYGAREVPSPLGGWSATYKDYNIYLRSAADGRSVPITSDGTDKYHWSLRSFSWSPNATQLFVGRVDWRRTPFVPIVHWLKPNVEDITYSPYPPPGGDPGTTELYLIDVMSKKVTPINAMVSPGDQLWPVGWRSDGSEVLFMRTDRDMKRLDLMAASSTTGRSRILVADRSDTFIERIIPTTDNLFYPLTDGKHFIWRSERDGFSNLYVYDYSGQLQRKLTAQTGPVERIAAIDESEGWVYFLASGDRSRPYDVHLYRVSINGGAALRLTESTGVHAPQFSPNHRYFIDTRSTVDHAPVVDLKSANGKQMQELARADISELQRMGWRAPEEFRVKAADGKTDLYGVLYKPADFDSNGIYPIIDLEYPGNFAHQAPRTFVGTWLGDEAQALTQLGFIVFIVDGRGTTGRGKAFNDFTFRGLGSIEVPDQIATLDQLAATRAFMDRSRVGITGYSWGGWLAIRAMLTAPNIFKVAVAGAPVVDLLGVEPYLGSPEKNAADYERVSNLPLADKLQGRLMMTTGTSDPGAPFGSVMRMANAFIKAGKHFDLIVFPEEEHQLSPAAMAYYTEARNRYFVEHLISTPSGGQGR